MYRIVFWFVPCLSVFVQSTIRDCGSAIGSYNNVTISNCDTASWEYCTLKQGSNATITINFNIENDISQVNVEVFGNMGDIEVPLLLNDLSNGCLETGLICPMQKASGSFTYSKAIYISEMYPKGHLTVKWKLKNENNENIICVLIPVKID